MLSLLAGGPEGSMVTNIKTKVQKKHLHGNLGGTARGVVFKILKATPDNCFCRQVVSYGYDLAVCFGIYKRVLRFFLEIITILNNSRFRYTR